MCAKTRRPVVISSQLFPSKPENVLVDALFDSIGDGAIVTDESSNIIRINDTALHILGYRRSEVLGKWYPRVIVAVDEDDKPIALVDRSIYKALIKGSPITEKVYYRRKNGQKVPVTKTVSPIILNKRPIGSINVFRDISLEHEIDRMKSEFISLAAHQLRTPLSSIKIHSHMLLDGYMGKITSEQQPALDNIIDASDRMNQLINTLLNISRMESGTISTVSETVRINVLTQKILDESSLQAADKKIDLVFRAPRTPLSTRTDRLIVKEILTNFVTNAIKYTPEGGNITVTVSAHDQQIVCSVSDTGIGIPKREYNKIFGKFSRVSNAIALDPDGTGLGLYLVKGLAERLGAAVWFDSQLGKGSTFYLSLPTQASGKK